MTDQLNKLQQDLSKTREASRELARCDDAKVRAVLETLAERTLANE